VAVLAHQVQQDQAGVDRQVNAEMMEKADLARYPPLGMGQLLGRGSGDMKILVRKGGGGSVAHDGLAVVG
jgi:hypothetical protein